MTTNTQHSWGTRREIGAWCLYDFANSAFTTIIVTAFYAPYFARVMVGADAPVGEGTYLWGTTVSLSAIAVALVAPILGAMADRRAAKKPALMAVSLLCVVATALLGFIPPGEWVWAALLFGLANFGFEVGNTLYNAFLPELVPPDRRGRISGMGWAVGYIGGLLCLAMVVPFAAKAFEPGGHHYATLITAITAGFFFVAALPTFIWLRERATATASVGSAASEAMGQMKHTLRTIFGQSPFGKFLLAYLIYNDGIVTIISFATIYSRDTLGFSVKDSLILLIVINIVGAAGAYGFGFIDDRLGPRHTIMLTLGLWIATCLAAMFTTDRTMFWGVAAMAGIALGSSQAASRTFVSQITPPGAEGEYFGLMGVCGRFSAIMGPWLFGLTSKHASQRAGVAVIGLFFVVGLALLTRVKDPVQSGNGTRRSR
jgi:MFS transporter, UMF1 family